MAHATTRGERQTTHAVLPFVGETDQIGPIQVQGRTTENRGVPGQVRVSPSTCTIEQDATHAAVAWLHDITRSSGGAGGAALGGLVLTADGLGKRPSSL